MLRLRIVVPLSLLSSLACTHALGEYTPNVCLISSTSVRCQMERERAFERARNAEVNASIAAVNAARAHLALSTTHCRTPDSTAPSCMLERAHELALALTHCKKPNSTTPRCETERAHAFAAARNAEISASLARVKAVRAREFAAARNAEINASMAKVAALRSFERARNAEIDASIANVERVRGRQFAAARNAEINASIARVKAVRDAAAFAKARNAEIYAALAAYKHERAHVLALALTHCKTSHSATPRCEAERAREFAAARNAEINASMAAVKAERARQFAAARNAEIKASIAAVEAERVRQFAAARNAESEASMIAVKAERALRQAMAERQSRLETGAIDPPDTINLADNAPIVRRSRHLGPCREAAGLMNPLQFTEGNAEIEPAMEPELDRVAAMAQACPSIKIELHGYSDNSGPAQINRHLAQRRARAAAEYLIQAGVSRSRLTTIGHASAQPVVPNTSAVNRALNRRVEVTIHDPAIKAAAQRVMWDLAETLDPAYVPTLARLSP